MGYSIFLCSSCTFAVFHFASAFNSDVSNWNTGAVTNMDSSKCNLSPSPWPRPQNSHTSVGNSFFLVAPSLAVFHGATVFNSDVSKWNMGAVKIMTSSKCTLFPSLWHTPTTTRVLSDHKSHTSVIVFCFWNRAFICCGGG